MQSRVNPRLTVTPDNWVVSFVRNNYHPYIVVESIGYKNYIDLGVEICDFVYKEDTSWFSCLWGIITNKKRTGEARIGGSLHIHIEEGQKWSREELFHSRHWDEKDVLSWLQRKENVLDMLADIRRDVELSQENKMVLQMQGHPIHNCATWAVEKLHMAAIPAKAPRHGIIDAKRVISKNLASFFHKHKHEKKDEINAQYCNTLAPVPRAILVPYRPKK